MQGGEIGQACLSLPFTRSKGRRTHCFIDDGRGKAGEILRLWEPKENPNRNNTYASTCIHVHVHYTCMCVHVCMHIMFRIVHLTYIYIYIDIH